MRSDVCIRQVASRSGQSNAWATDGRAFVVAPAVPTLLSEVAKKPTKVRGQKRHIAVDFTGLLLAAIGWAHVSPWRLIAAGRRTSNVGAVRWRHILPAENARHSLGAGAANAACWTG